MKKLIILTLILPLFASAYHAPKMPTWYVPFPKELRVKNLTGLNTVAPAPNVIRGWYYSETSGNNTTGNGTIGNPYLDQTKSISAGAGDSMLFERGGDYTGKISKSTASLYVGAYGTGAAPVIIYAGADAARNRYPIYLSGSNCKVENLNITYPTQTSDRSVVAYVSIGVYFDAGSSCTVNNCTFSKIGIGVFVADGNNHVISNCTFNDLRMVVSDATLDNDYGANGFVMDNSSGNLFISCYFKDCFAPSVDYQIDGGAGESYNPCSNNTIKYCTIRDCDGVMEIGSGSGGTSFNNRAVYNLIINSSLTYTSASGGFPVQCDRMRYWNNTIIDTLNLGLHNALLNYAGTQTSDTVFDFRNNTVFVKGGVKVIDPTDTALFKHSYNVAGASSGSSIGFTLKSNERSSTANAEFVSMSTVNYHLKSTATAVGLANYLGVTPDLDGVSVSNPTDAGAYQYVTPIIPTNTTIRLPGYINGKLYGRIIN